MKTKLVILIFLFGTIKVVFGQALMGPLEGKYPTKMGTYMIRNKEDNSFFLGNNYDQPPVTDLTQLQWALADVQKVEVLNMPTISKRIYDRYNVKPKSIHLSLLINNLGDVIFVRFTVNKDYRITPQSSVMITADELADIEDMVKKYKFTFTGNIYNLPYFSYGFYVEPYN